MADEPGDSIFSLLDPSVYDKINFIVTVKNRFVVMNLGWLVGYKEKMTEKARQYRLLLMLNKLVDIASSLSTDDDIDSNKPKVNKAERISIDDINEDDDEDKSPDNDTLTDSLMGGYGDDNDAGLVDSKEEEARIEKELEELERIREEANAEVINDDDEIEERIDANVLDIKEDSRPAIVQKADELLRSNHITPAAHKRLVSAQKVFKELKNPYGEGSIEDAMVIKEEDYVVEEKEITDDKVVLDDKMKVSRVDSYQEKYIKHALKADTVACISAIQKFPVAITKYDIEDKSDAMTEYEEHVIRVVPAVGSPSVLRIPVLKIREDGTFKYLGKMYKQRMQRTDCPIRKINPTQVLLSSYAGKITVGRSGRSKFNYAKWMNEYLMAEATNSESDVIVEPSISTVVNYGIKLPYIYTVISSTLAHFKNRGILYVFDHKKRIEKLNLTDDDLKYEKDGSVIVAKTSKGIIVLDMSDELILVNEEGLEKPLGTFETMFGINSRVPLPIADISVYGKDIPAGISLGYLIGLEGLCKVLRAEYRLVPTGERLQLNDDEYAIRFKNESMVFNKADRRLSLIMAGFVRFERYLRHYDRAHFNSKDVYTPLLEKAGIAARYLKELDAYNIGFIDPITEDILKQMDEPIEFIGLIIRAVELLMDEYVPSKLSDPKGKVELAERVRGYERVPGTIYESLFKAMRTYAARATRSDAKININPLEALGWVVMDPTTSIVNNINPIHSLREREVITFGGRYGRSKRAMVARTRLYTPEDMGFISEASVDSGDIGVITYLAPNANLTTIRGTVRLYDKKRDGESALLSTSAQLMPGADGDDPKRMGFISIQLGHQIATKTKDVQSYRTGGERLIINRMGKEYGAVAPSEGKVVSITDNELKVKYKDGTEQSYLIGATEVTAEGSFYPHTLVTNLKVGEKVEKGDVLYYNEGFFIQDPLNKKRVNYSLGITAFTAFREANYTIEDSSAISEDFSKKMSTQVTKLKSKIIDFSQEVSNVLKVGAEVDLDTVLMQIDDAYTHDMDKDELTSALKRFAALTPRAGVVGKVTKIEAYYNGELAEMSDSLRKLVTQCEKVRKEEAAILGEKFFPNQISRRPRIDGLNAESGQAIIVFHMAIELGMGVADKLVFSSQLKSTVGQVLFGKTTTQEGEDIDAIFGALSGINRIVTSVYKQGTVNTYLRYVGEEAYKLWKE